MLRLHDTSIRLRRSSRAGFSLIEMLVSIAIFVILATLALSAFRDSKHDKVASASRQIFASIGGARSRAAKAVEPRGVRLQQSKLDYRLISSLQYVGQSQMYDGYLRVQINSSGTVQLKCNQSLDWQILRNEGLLRPGSRIYLRNSNPNDTNPSNITPDLAFSTGGRWYTIATQGFDPDNDKMRIVGLIDGAQWNSAANSGAGAYQSYPADVADAAEPTYSNTYPIPYLLRLSPQELPDAEAINLPPGMVIDLPSSRIPASWAAFEDRNQNGDLDTGAPTEDLNSNGILDDVKFDIPVSPNGTVSGAISGSGPIYLYLCHIDDVDRMRNMTGYPADAAITLAPTYLIPGDFENGYGPDHPSSERKLVCIIPQTGLVYIAPVNGADADNNGYADDPYSFAREGREDR